MEGLEDAGTAALHSTDERVRSRRAHRQVIATATAQTGRALLLAHAHARGGLRVPAPGYHPTQDPPP